MSATGKKPGVLRSTIQAALDGQTVTGTYLSLVLNKGQDPLDLGSMGAAQESIHGGFTVLVKALPTGNGITPQTDGGSVQRMYRYMVTIKVGMAMPDPEKLDTDMYVIAEAIVNLVDAALEPQTGVNWNVTRGGTFDEPKRLTEDFLFQEVVYECTEAWAR